MILTLVSSQVTAPTPGGFWKGSCPGWGTEGHRAGGYREEDGEVHSQTPERSALSSKSHNFSNTAPSLADCAAKWERGQVSVGWNALCGDRALAAVVGAQSLSPQGPSTAPCHRAQVMDFPKQPARCQGQG